MKNLLEKDKYLFPALICTLLLVFIWAYINNTLIYFDDIFIIGPIIEKISSGNYPFLRYPLFPFIFFEKLIMLGKILGFSEDPYILGRAINALLLPLNSLLFFIVTKNYLKRNWALYGALIFGLSPVIFFSSASVKTESLLLMQFSFSLLLGQTWKKDIHKYYWPILSGITSALAMGTKFNFSIPFIFLLFSFLALLEKENKKAILISILIYLISTFLAVYLLFPTILNFEQFAGVSEIKNDIMFSPFPNAWRATNEWSLGLTGRFSFAFFHSLPLAMGPLIFISFIIAHIFKTIPKNILITWGVFSLIHFIGFSMLTLYRIPYYYTLCVPYGVIAHVYLLKAIFNLPRLNYLKLGLIFSFLFYQFYNFRGISDFFYEYSYVINKILPELRLNYLRYEKSYKDLFYWELNLKSSAVKGDQVDTYVLGQKPKYIFTSKGMMTNYCWYKKNKIYSRHCKYFSELLMGQKDYHLIWKREIPLPFYNPLYQEKNFSFYLLERS